MNEYEKRKVVPHPYVKERLLTEGMNALKEKRYKEAYTYLTQLKELQLHDDDVEMALVVCLFEMGHVEEAKERCEQLLERGRGDWTVYISMLVHLQQYDEVVAVIHKLQRKGIDCTPFYHFYSLVKNDSVSARTTGKTIRSDFRKRSMAETTTHPSPIRFAHRSTPCFYFSRYLHDEMKHPIVKTTMLCILRKEQVMEPMTVKNLDKR